MVARRGRVQYKKSLLYFAALCAICLLLALATFSPIQQHSVMQQGPLSVGELGRHVWPYLHTFAATVPSHPNEQQQQEIKQFMQLL